MAGRSAGSRSPLSCQQRNIICRRQHAKYRLQYARLSCNLRGGAAMRIASVGHAVFAATFIVLGIQGLIPGDFARILGQLPKDIAWREVLAVLIYLRPFIYLACGFGLFWQRGRGAAARLLV